MNLIEVKANDDSESEESIDLELEMEQMKQQDNPNYLQFATPEFNDEPELVYDKTNQDDFDWILL